LAISNGIATVQQLFAQKVTTNELCVGTTCVNQQQLAQLLAQLNNSGAGGSAGGSTSFSAAEPPDGMLNFASAPNVTTGSALGIAIVSLPANGVVSGTAEFDVNITLAPSTTISRVDYQVDGNELGQGLWTNNPEYSYSWNTESADLGSHAVTAIITDSTGATSSASVTVTVQNGGTVATSTGDLTNTAATTTTDATDTATAVDTGNDTSTPPSAGN
jgi:hypothetical protein